jgi:hypothetical protein
MTPQGTGGGTKEKGGTEMKPTAAHSANRSKSVIIQHQGSDNQTGLPFVPIVGALNSIASQLAAIGTRSR